MKTIQHYISEALRIKPGNTLKSSADVEMYFYFDVLSDNFDLKFDFTQNVLEYSINTQSDWKEFKTTTVIRDVKKGERIYFKGTNIKTKTYFQHGMGSFQTVGSFNIGGNILSLIYGDDFRNKTDLLSDSQFENLFYDCVGLESANNLMLSHIKGLTHKCFSRMFYGCVSLKYGPKLPNTDMVFGCFARMFLGCANLIETPKLPSLKLAESCYEGMFERCTLLKNAPELPAKRLFDNCYKGMFTRCIRLENCPELPATKLTHNCYAEMFTSCFALRTVPELPAMDLAYGCYMEMFKNCEKLENVQSVLPAMKLTKNCYNGMYKGCKSLKNAPELPAEIIFDYCYYDMFNGCIKLETITMLAKNIKTSDSLNNWVKDVQPGGTFTKSKDIIISKSVNGVPRKWKINEI